MAELDIDAVISRLTFDPINGDDLLKIIFQNVDSSAISSSLKDTVINPLINKIRFLYEKAGTNVQDLTNNKDKLAKISEPAGLFEFSKKATYAKDLGEKVISPIVSKLKSLYSKVEKEIDDNQDEKIGAMADPTGIIELRKDSKDRIKDVIDKMTSRISGDTSPDIKSYSNQSNDSDNIKISDDGVSSVRFSDGGLKELLSSVLTVKIQKSGSEQDTFDDPSDKGNNISDALAQAFEKIGLSKNLEKLERSNNSIIDVLKELNLDPNKTMGILGMIAAGAALVGVVGMFWGSHIKPWIEEKFGIKFDFLDKFSGIFESIEKWFYVGGAAAGGAALRIGGEIFETAGKLGEKMIGKVFSALLGEGAEKGLGAGTMKLLSGATVKKILGKTLGNVGKAALRGIPIIGSLISLGFAIDNFQKGNTTQGLLDLLNGVVGLIPGVGIPLSLGVSALQIMLEVQTLDLEGSEKNSAQASMVWSGIKGIWGSLKKTPFIQTFVNLSEGLYKLTTGDFRGGFEQLNGVPVIGTIITPFMAFFDNIEHTSEGGLSFNFKGFMKDFKRRTLRGLLSWFPSVFGFRSKLADMMGMGDEFRQDEYDSLESSDVTNAENNVKKMIGSSPHSQDRESSISKNIEELNKKLENSKKQLENEKLKNSEISSLKAVWDGEYFANKEGSMEQDVSYYASQLNKERGLLELEKSKKRVKADDLFLPSKSVYNPSNNTQYDLAPDDNVLAYKSGGMLDTMLGEMKNAILTMSNTIVGMQKSDNSQGSNVNVNNVSNVSNASGGDSSMSGKRDPIFDSRTNYWRKYPNERSFA